MDEAAALQPRISDASDHSLLVAFGDQISPEAHLQVRRLLHLLAGDPPAGLVNLQPAYASLLVSYDPRKVRAEDVRSAVAAKLDAAGDAPLPDARLVDIPLCYGGDSGPDLEEVATACGLDPGEVVREHSAGDYVVYFLGFSPGFPYLGGLSARIAAPRRATPRKRVPAGSVAIGGNQTGIYPLASPGGWQLIGRTPLALFDPARTPPALLALGDRVRFVPITADEFQKLAPEGEGETQGGAEPSSGVQVRVVEPGFQSTLQDLGRPGYAHVGVSASGPADALSLRVANWLVGNAEGAAALEMTLTGGTFAFSAPGVIALTGSDLEPVIDGYRIPLWTAIEVRQGQTLTCGSTRSGARSYLAVRGGLVAPPVLGSLSTHLTTGLGGLQGRALRGGDVLTIGEASSDAPSGRRFPREVANGLLRRDVLRITRGAQWELFGEEAWAAILASTYVVSEDSSRMGLRLRGAPLAAARQGSMLTEGVSLGALQVPPDGNPILSFVEHQTTGGYPQVGCVITADLHRAGQLRPRDEVRFEEVSLAGAAEALRECESILGKHLERSP
jgi:KipI family sensor histidine kinase inhibitor